MARGKEEGAFAGEEQTMTPGLVLRRERQQEQNLDNQMERQMGCMAGFFQLFDGHQIFAGKRIYSTTKRLPSSSGTSSPSPSERSDISPPSFSKELGKTEKVDEGKKATVKVGANKTVTPVRSSTTTPLHLFEVKEGTKGFWKLREAPRLSLDSRLLDRKGKLFPPEIRTTATAPMVDATDEQQRRSPSVVARLMGLDLLPKANDSEGEVVTSDASAAAELRRSASESRVTKDFLQYPFIQERNGNHTKEKIDSKAEVKTKLKPSKPPLTPSPPPPTMPKNNNGVVQRRTRPFFNAQDVFPEPAKRGTNNDHQYGAGGNLANAGGGLNLYGEFEKRLRMRGIDEREKDLEALKQILEALQLKGLLHSTPHHRSNKINTARNLVFDRHSQSPIVLMKPVSAANKPLSRLGTSPPTPPRRTSSNNNNLSSTRRMETMEGRGGRNSRMSSDRIGVARSPSSPVRRTSPNLDRRTSPSESPRSGQISRRNTDLNHRRHDQPSVRSPRMKKQQQPSLSSTVERFSDDSESSHSTSSQFELERMKAEEYTEGRSLLERCDKLLHSIAKFTGAEQQQPSPVSVLDSAASFSDGCGGDAPSPSPMLKRRMDFRDGGEAWDEIRVGPSQLLIPEDDEEAGDRDFNYVAEILGSTNVNSMSVALAMPLDVYLSLEKWHQGEDSSKASRMHRRLVFDTVAEIVERNRQLSSWEAFSRSSSMVDCESRRVRTREIWVELKRIRERVHADDLCELVCNVLRKDMTRETRSWSDRSIEMSDAVLDIERLIFKDLVAETIKDLSASVVQKCRPATATVAPRRKLLF